jgi:hypothetical protein
MSAPAAAAPEIAAVMPQRLLTLCQAGVKPLFNGVAIASGAGERRLLHCRIVPPGMPLVMPAKQLPPELDPKNVGRYDIVLW